MKILFALFVILFTSVVASQAQTPTASFSTGAISVKQSAGEVRITVSVTHDPLSDFFGTAVRWQAVAGTAICPYDYDAAAGIVTFHKGERSKDLILGLSQRSSYSGTRSFSIRLENASDYNIGTPSTTLVTIVGNNHKGPTLKLSQRKQGRGRVKVTAIARDAAGLTTTRRMIVAPGR